MKCIISLFMHEFWLLAHLLSASAGIKVVISELGIGSGVQHIS